MKMGLGLDRGGEAGGGGSAGGAPGRRAPATPSRLGSAYGVQRIDVAGARRPGRRDGNASRGAIRALTQKGSGRELLV